MDRRRVIGALLGLGLAAFARAQPKKGMARIGFLSLSSAKAISHLVHAFREGMEDVGYSEGRNLAIEYRWADGDAERLPQLARELVALKPALIVAHATPAASALKRVTSDIPLVMVNVGDPVRNGFAKGLRRPGGNMTGVASAELDASARQFELMTQIVPKGSVFAVLVNPANESNESAFRVVDEQAKKAKQRAVRVPIRAAGEIDKAFQAMRRDKTQGVIVPGDPLFVAARAQLAKAALGARMPSVYAQREHAEAGGLASYGSNAAASFRRAAAYVVKILNGAKPAEMPIDQPTTFELVVNLKTAQALKVSLPKELLSRADRVIQ
ncbi:MAG TPA: ABC transporter substrate-binding protein [Burkholderiales bacterium]|nr:ABC transporter substrate-binding protein [Burkholderiales bacterium]